MANDNSHLTSSATTSLDDAAASFDVSNWHGKTDTDQWAQTPSSWWKDRSIEFRVRCEGHPTRRLRLAGARYTLGSGVGCSIRLEDASLRPLHAVLIRDCEQILVRAYSEPFSINDVRTSEGILDIGDRLRLGAYEFELLESSPRPHDAVSQAVAHGLVGFDGQAESRGEGSSEDWSRSFYEEAKQWRALKQDVQRRDAWCQTRERELHQQQQTLSEQLELLQNREEELQTQESAAVEVHEEFQHRYNDLLRHRDELRMQQEELNTGREHLRLQQERLDGRDRLHRQQIEKLLGERENYKQQESLTQQKLAESDERVRASRRQAEAATSAVEQMREKFASLNAQLAQLSQQQETLQQAESERTRELQLRCEDLEFDRDEAVSNRDEIAGQRDQIAREHDRTAAQRDQIASQRDALSSERDEIARQRDAATSERDVLSRQRDALTRERDEITSQRDAASRQRDEIACQRDAAMSERDQIASQRDTLAQRCEEFKSIEEQLHDEISELQGEIARTRLDAETLDKDCVLARQTISNLEETIRENHDRHEVDRQSWTAEVDVLRANLDALSVDLAGAQAQLSRLREENDRLADQLTGAHAERDEARAEREVATRQCEAARRECDAAKMDCEEARRDLAAARDDVKRARQERDDAAAQRDAISTRRDELFGQQETLNQELAQSRESAQQDRERWDRQQHDAEHRYQEAQAQLADARQKCDDALRTRDEAESARLAAEQKLECATRELQAMQAQRDLAVAEQEDLRRQRDSAVKDAQDTRELFDRSNRDHDETLGRIENLERRTREVISAPSETPEVEAAPRLGLLRHDAEPEPIQMKIEPIEHSDESLCDEVQQDESVALNEDVSSAPAPPPGPVQWMVEPTDSPQDDDDDDDVWPMYSSSEPLTHKESSDSDVSPTPDETSASRSATEAPAPQPIFDKPESESLSMNDIRVSEREIADQVAGPLVSEVFSIHDTSAGLNAGEATAAPIVEPVSEIIPTSEVEPASELEPLAQSEPVEESLPQSPEESHSHLFLNEQQREEQEASVERWNESSQADFSQPAVEPHVFNPPAFNEPGYSEFNFSQPNDFEPEYFEPEYNEPASIPPPTSSPTSEQPVGSLADQLMRDLGIEKKGLQENTEETGEQPVSGFNEESNVANLYHEWRDEEALHCEPSSDEAVSGMPTPSVSLSDPEPVVSSYNLPHLDEGSESDDPDAANATLMQAGLAATTAVPDSDSDEDDSIEAYMNRLLQRVQGGAEPAAVQEPAPKANTKSKPVSETPVSATKESETSPENHAEASGLPPQTSAAEGTDLDSPLVPRSQAPERNSDLSAMRDLANASARSAITRSQKTQSHTTRMQAMVKFVQAGIAMICGIAAVALVALPMLKIIAAVAALVIAGICVKEGISLLTDLNTRSRPSRADTPEPPRSEAIV